MSEDVDTNPGGRPPTEQLLEHVYDLSFATHERLGKLEIKVDSAIRPVSFPRVPLWGIVIALFLIAGGIFAHEVRAGEAHAAVGR